METEKQAARTYMHVSAYKVVLYFLVPLPLLGALTCVVLSMIYDFKRSTATHCRVPNYLPSISSAIGDATPQKYIWRICIALHISPRFFKGLMLYKYYRSLVTRSWPRLYLVLVHVALVVHFMELFSLLMLSYISWSDNHWLHENSFVMFMVCSLVYMLLTCIIMKWGHASCGMSTQVGRCYWYEKIFFVSNFSSFMIAIYFYFRHNTYCESGVYTLFAAMEYITVITNICFHGSAAVLFGKDSIINVTFGEKKNS